VDEKKMSMGGETPLKLASQILQQRLVIGKVGGYFAPITQHGWQQIVIINMPNFSVFGHPIARQFINSFNN
jgi:hypothetical protein